MLEGWRSYVTLSWNKFIQVHEVVKKFTPFSGWWFQPLWKILVSWDDYSQYMEKSKMFQTTNQFSKNKSFPKQQGGLHNPWAMVMKCHEAVEKGPTPSHKHTVSLGAAVALDQIFSASLGLLGWVALRTPNQFCHDLLTKKKKTHYSVLKQANKMGNPTQP